MPEQEDRNHDTFFDRVNVNNGGRLVHYIYKNVRYSDNENVEKNCIVEITLYPLMITFVEYEFPD